MVIVNKNIEDIMEKNIGDYSFNINLFRSFPNVYDGMKPVARRVAYTCYDMKLAHNKPHRKVAAVVGGCLGAYHPHGDTSVADALVKMAQPFYTRSPLIDIMGNGGSISGDPAAAMRYIECRPTKYLMDNLDNIEKNAINWRPNYDGSLMEPETLPVKYPNLLINGSYGIGQGFISSIPPHNFNEVCDMTIKVINDPNILVDDLLEGFAPDYPTGGVIVNGDDLKEAYKTGNGVVRLRAKITNINGDLVITEIPYMTNVGAILDKLQEVCKDGRIESISDIVDQTNEKNGVRVIIKLKRGADPKMVENQLYSLTPLQSTMQISLIATEDNTFRTYNLPETVHKWIEYRKQTIKRTFNFEMSKLRRRIHIIDGLLICLADLERLVTLVKSTKGRQDTVDKLMKEYKLTNIQAEAIADLQLYRLSNLNVKELKTEKKEKGKALNDYAEYFVNDRKLCDYIIEELENGKKLYGTERNTLVVGSPDEVNVDESDYTVFVTKENFVKKIKLDMKTNTTGCRGRSVGKIKDGDAIISGFNINNRDKLLLFTNTARMFIADVHQIRETNLNALGVTIDNYVKLKDGEKIITVLPLAHDNQLTDSSSLVFVTRNGFIKRTMMDQYINCPSNGIIAASVADDDTLIGVKRIDSAKCDVIIATKDAGATRFNISEVTCTGRNTRGLIGAKLKDGDTVVTFDILETGKERLIVLDSAGNGKRFECKTFPAAKRNTACKMITKLKKGDSLVSIAVIGDDEEVTVLSTSNMVKVKAKDIPLLLKSSSPKPIIKLEKGDSIIDFFI